MLLRDEFLTPLRYRGSLRSSCQENLLGALSNSVRPFDYTVKAGHRPTKLNKIRQDFEELSHEKS